MTDRNRDLIATVNGIELIHQPAVVEAGDGEIGGGFYGLTSDARDDDEPLFIADVASLRALADEIEAHKAGAPVEIPDAPTIPDGAECPETADD